MIRSPLCLALVALTASGCSLSAPEAATSVPPAASVAPRNAFYKKQVVASGISIRASEKVSDAALAKARDLISAIDETSPALIRSLAGSGVTVAIVGVGENKTDLPEFAALRPRLYHDILRRSTGGTTALPVATVGEENLLGYRGDPGAGESLLVKSIASTVAGVSLASDESFCASLDAAYDNYLSARIPGESVTTPDREAYWAEGVAAWFDAGRAYDRSGLKRADPALAALVAKVFGEGESRIHPADTDKNPVSPEFVVPPEFKAWEIRFRRGEETLAPPRATLLPMLPPGLHRSLRPDYLSEWKSPATPGSPGRLFFVNASDSPVRLEIVKADGLAVPAGRLFPGQHAERETTSGAVWRILDDKTRKVRGYTVAVPGNARRVIKSVADEDADFADAGELENENPTDLALLSPEGRTVWASSEPSHETTVFIRNESSTDILLESADRAGELSTPDRLRPGDHVTYDTFRDQVWRITRPDGTAPVYVIASAGPGIATVTDKKSPSHR